MSSIKKRIKISLSNLFEEIFLKESKNIAHWRRRNALEETGRFVEQHLPKTRSYKSRYELYDAIVRQIEGRTGLVCEFGVAGGRSINYLAGLMPGHTLFGFDSFEGLPDDWIDGLPRGAYRQAKLPKVASNVRLIRGLFDSSLPEFLAGQKEDALFLHIDCDLYASTKTVLELIGPRIKRGTVLCFDEFFNYPGWQNGEYQALMEFVSQTAMKFEYLGYNSAGTQLALQVLL